MSEEKSLMLDIFERLGGIDAKLDGINNAVNSVSADVDKANKAASEAKSTADEALSSAKSAHHRLNKIDKIIFWASTTIIGAVILALLALVIKTN